jgi:GMP synthase (glutamine-hydrolysing)
MRPILFVRCDPVETFGVGLDAVVAAGGEVVTWEAIDPDAKRPALDDVGGVALFGSTFNVEHADEQPFIKEVGELTREAIERDVPFLGLCFGAQVLAWTMEARVHKAPVREVGFEPLRPRDGLADDPVLGHFADGDPVFQWHMDTFELPDGATLLATGDRVANQAIRMGEAAWATQFHLEIDAAEAELWLRSFAEEGGDLKGIWGKSPEEVRDEIIRWMPDHEERGREVFRRFVEFARRRAA